MTGAELATLLQTHVWDSQIKRCKCGVWLMDSTEWSIHVALQLDSFS